MKARQLFVHAREVVDAVAVVPVMACVLARRRWAYCVVMALDGTAAKG